MSTVRNTKLGGIVTDGLLLSVDSAKKESYPRVGSTWSDISGNDYEGTLYNEPSFNLDNYYGIDFNGTNQYCDFGTNILTGYQSFTVDMIVKIDTFNNGAIISANNSSNRGFIIWLTNPVRFQFGDNTNDSYFNCTVAQSEFTLDTWLNITFVLSGKTGSAYVNNILKSGYTNTSDVYWTGTGSLKIGRRDTNTAYSDIEVSSLNVYDRALTEDERTQNYNINKNRYGLT